MLDNLKIIWSTMHYVGRVKAFILFAKLILLGVIEMFGVVSILPLIAVLSDPSIISSNPFLNQAYTLTGITNQRDFLVLLTLIVFVFTSARIAFNAYANYSILKFTQMSTSSLSVRLLSSYLKQPYEKSLSRHSAEMGRTVLTQVEDVMYSSYVPALELFSKFITSSVLIGLLIAANPLFAVIVFVLSALLYLAIFKKISNVLRVRGEERLKLSELRFKISQESLRGLKEIKVRNAIDFYINLFRNITRTYQLIKLRTSLLKQIPQVFVQISTIGIILFSIIVMLLQYDSESYTKIIPTFAFYALIGMRIIPISQGIFKNLTTLKFGTAALLNLNKDLRISDSYLTEQSVLDENTLPENNKNETNVALLEVKNVSYTYPESSTGALCDVSLQITRNTSVAFVGSSGAGKTTLTDLILGLLIPNSGEIRYNGVSVNKSNINHWRKMVGYVPQDIFMLDDSIINNIAFGTPLDKIDMNKVKKAAEMANLSTFIENELISGYNTFVGENGILLSGGQRQRLGIARALYHEPEILVFDEATSALDNITERMVMESITNLKSSFTVIMVAHRLSSIASFDNIFLLDKGQIIDSGDFESLIKRNNLFREMAKFNS